MATYTVKVPDEQVLSLGTLFGNPNNPDEAIQAALQGFLDEKLAISIDQFDADVLQKRQELSALIESKKATTKDQK